jgi:hypothetical protein
MTLHCLSDPPPVWLGEALERFERQFSYPLGAGQRFRISHGRDYLPFFQAMGTASVLVVERAGEVLGTLTRVERLASLPCDNFAPKLVHYLCDLKVAASSRGSRVLPLLMRETRLQIEASGSLSCYAIVMGGTGRLPTDYTGRVSIPRFEKLGDIMIVRVSAATSEPQSLKSGDFRHMDNSIRITGGQHALRSSMTPISVREGDASAVLEDTRRGKRLWIDGAGELLSAHLSHFQFQTIPAAATLLQKAAIKAQRSGFPAFFTAMPQAIWNQLQPALHDLSVQESPASIFGHHLPSNCDWWIDTAEI